MSHYPHIAATVPRDQYQEGHLRERVTGVKCPECGRVFENRTCLRGHRAVEHDLPDKTRENELKRWREKKRKSKK